jgi:hypothetical protein
MLHKTYVSELTRSLEYLPTWLPTTELRLGDLVVASGDSLRRVGHIGDCGLAFTPRFGTSRANFEYLSSGGVSITSKLAGQIFAGSTLAKAEAGLVVRFSRADAIVFEASGCKSIFIADLEQLGRAIRKLHSAGEWDRNVIIVTELIEAASVTVMISASHIAQVDLKANGDVRQGGISLSDLNAKLEAKHTVDVGFKIIASKGLTPLYRAGGIKRTWLGDTRFRPRSHDVAADQIYNFGNLSADDLFE